MRHPLFSALVLSLVMMLSGAAHADVKIAVVGPMTGQDAAFGEQFKIGAELAVEDINASGGVLGEQIEMKIYDDACDPRQAVAVANRVAGDGASLVVGHFCSDSSIPASKVYEEEGIIQISPGSTNPILTDQGGPNIFRVCGRDDQQGGFAGSYLAKNFSDKNIAVVHDRSIYGKGLAQETKKALNAAGKQEVFHDTFTKGERDLTALVSKLKQNEIDVVYLGGYYDQAGLLVRQMRDQGLGAILVGGDTLMTMDYAAIAGQAADGTMMTFSPDPRSNPSAAEAVKRLRAKGIEPEGYVLYAYAAIQAWKQAAELAGSTDPAKVTEALHAGKFDTVIGEFQFDDKGDPSLTPFAFYRWQDGSYKQIN